ncbi:sulfotransferase family 2 domain-containing protein [Myxosarcina sp. GI1]|uniref:sulfotransferase family 2 domain-containing protein n=1 Tax=Myxosarcina sp. GI1 TaxID=1541065 RepID=UPI00068B9E81|nr:sulfotransferase family 2 domain-containing protein [Myxosarcina sp. GI1]
MLLKKAFYSLPHDTRRLLFSQTKPQAFKRMQQMRAIDTIGGCSYKPFDRHQCIFVHVPKAAGVSICKALFGNFAGHHTTLSKYQLVFSQSEFDRYFKFTFVRNPWDRVFSAYNFLQKGGLTKEDKRWAAAEIAPFASFDDFVRMGLHKPIIQKWRHFRPQVDFLLIPGSSKLQVDFLGFFENLQEDFQYVVDKLNIHDIPDLKHENATNPHQKLDYKDFYTDKTRNIVAEIYKSDLDIFGYSFDNSSLRSQIKNRY